MSDWIRVTERLPKNGQTVIIEGGIGYWREPSSACPDGAWITLVGHDWGREIQWEVTHWMPLPEPPK